MTMVSARNRLTLLTFASLVLLLPLTAFAAGNEPVGHMVATPATIEWQVGVGHDSVVLNVSGPNDFSFTKEFSGNPILRLQDRISAELLREAEIVRPRHVENHGVMADADLPFDG